LTNPANAVWCDCGYDFATGAIQKNLEERRVSRSRSLNGSTSPADDPDAARLWFRGKVALAAEVVVQLFFAKPAEGRAAEVPSLHVAELVGAAVGATILPLLVLAIACIWSGNRTSRRMANILFASSLVCLAIPILTLLSVGCVRQMTQHQRPPAGSSTQ
jgi:hypothetical protein